DLPEATIFHHFLLCLEALGLHLISTVRYRDKAPDALAVHVHPQTEADGKVEQPFPEGSVHPDGLDLILDVEDHLPDISAWGRVHVQVVSVVRPHGQRYPPRVVQFPVDRTDDRVKLVRATRRCVSLLPLPAPHDPFQGLELITVDEPSPLLVT